MKLQEILKLSFFIKNINIYYFSNLFININDFFYEFNNF